MELFYGFIFVCNFELTNCLTLGSKGDTYHTKEQCLIGLAKVRVVAANMQLLELDHICGTKKEVGLKLKIWELGPGEAT